MKLSEAMMLGSTLGHCVANNSWNTCLLGMSCHAIGKTNFGNWEALHRWPWLSHVFSNSPMYSTAMPAHVIITGLCDEVLEKNMSLEQVVDWVRSVEPDEPVETEPKTSDRETCLIY